jgi:hypothetical protein
MEGGVMTETFVCVACDRQLDAEELAFDTDPEHRLGVCIGCDQALQEAEALPGWAGGWRRWSVNETPKSAVLYVAVVDRPADGPAPAASTATTQHSSARAETR